MTSLQFAKVQACGADYIAVDGDAERLFDPSTLSLMLCDRGVGIGAQGLLILGHSAVADAAVRLFDAEGSERRPEIGALFCAARFLAEGKFGGFTPENRREITLETNGETAVLTVLRDGSRVRGFRLSVENPTFDPDEIPLLGVSGEVVGGALAGPEPLTALRLGVPGAVAFPTLSPAAADPISFAASCRESGLFLDSTLCVEAFLRKETENSLTVRAATLAGEELRGSMRAALLALAAAEKLGKLELGSPCNIFLWGGELFAMHTEDGFTISADATVVFSGRTGA